MLRIYFTNVAYYNEYEVKNSYSQLSGFIAPQELLKLIEQSLPQAPLTPDELAALTNLPDDERALKLFFHAHLLANPTTAPL